MESEPAVGRSQVWLKPDVCFNRGCRVCITAESGSGKSSLLAFIYGNRADYDGRIEFDGSDIRGNGIDRWCALRTASLALLPQEMRLFPELTVRQNIDIKNCRTGHKSDREITTLLERLGIADKGDVEAGKLSIGQQQRVAIVRAVCQPFDFIMLDEPVSHLDDANNRIVADIVGEEAARQGAGIISTSVGHHLLLEGAEFVNL